MDRTMQELLDKTFPHYAEEEQRAAVVLSFARNARHIYAHSHTARCGAVLLRFNSSADRQARGSRFQVSARIFIDF
jgi:nitrogen-specific signal transduction histidine kinase